MKFYLHKLTNYESVSLQFNKEVGKPRYVNLGLVGYITDARGQRCKQAKDLELNKKMIKKNNSS